VPDATGLIDLAKMTKSGSEYGPGVVTVEGVTST
jgi:hypothetical protein